jgi:hypothetical protein
VDISAQLVAMATMLASMPAKAESGDIAASTKSPDVVDVAVGTVIDAVKVMHR